jgi:hypothetical protein
MYLNYYALVLLSSDCVVKSKGFAAKELLRGDATNLENI